jgi:hypothetical protein
MMVNLFQGEGRRMKIMRRPAEVLLCAALILSAAVPSLATPKTGSFRLGKVHVVPILGFDIEHTSNLFLAPDDRRQATGEESDSDNVATLQYGVEFVLPAVDWTISLGGRALTHWYQEYDSQNNTDVQVFATAAADFPGGLGVKIEDTYDLGWLLASNEFGPGEDFEFNHLVVGAYYTFNEDWRIRGEWTNNWINSEQTHDRDRVENIFSGWIYRRIAAKTALSLGATYSDYNYDDNPVADNNATEVNAGVTWDMTNKTRGNIQGGYEWKNYDELSERDDGEYWTLSAGVNYRPLRKTSTYFEARRQTEETSFVDNPWYLHSELYGKVTQDLTKRLYLTGLGRVWVDDYPNTAVYRGQTGDREDQAYHVEGRLGLRLIRGLSLEGRLGYEKRDSNFDSLDYDETIAMITLNAGLALDYERYRRRY